MKKALIIMNVQDDFVTGPMSVKGATKIVPIINKISNEFDNVIICKDWHPYVHSSFDDYNGNWPRHCVSNHNGSRLYKDLIVPKGAFFIQKGTNIEHEVQSAFVDDDGSSSNGLDVLLKKSLDTHVVYICGLTTENSVLHTALDAYSMGFDTNVVLNACAEREEKECRKAYERMKTLGIMTWTAVFDNTDKLLIPTEIKTDC